MKETIYFLSGILVGLSLSQVIYFLFKRNHKTSRQAITNQVSNELEEQQREAIKELRDATKNLKKHLDMDTMTKAFEVSHPTFESHLRAMTETKLSKRDIYLCILIHEGKRTSEIAQILAISESSVEVARHRLRTKLGIDKGENMTEILKNM